MTQVPLSLSMYTQCTHEKLTVFPVEPTSVTGPHRRAPSPGPALIRRPLLCLPSTASTPGGLLSPAAYHPVYLERPFPATIYANPMDAPLVCVFRNFVSIPCKRLPQSFVQRGRLLRCVPYRLVSPAPQVKGMMRGPALPVFGLVEDLSMPRPVLPFHSLTRF